MDSRELVNFVKNKIINLESYSQGEEYLLVIDTLNLSKEKLILGVEITGEDYKKVLKIINERLKNKPLNKIFHKQNFYGLDFFVNNNVLAPRKETELLVEKVIKSVCSSNKQVRILDLCCGSGCIGLSLKKQLGDKAKVILSDISTKAIYVARKNAKILDLNESIEIRHGDMFNVLKTGEKFDIIVSNPPYINSDTIKGLSQDVIKFDPIIALDGGQDGYDFYREIALKSKQFLNKNGSVFLEIGFDQGKEVENIFKNQGFDVKCFKDYSQNDRIIVAKS